MTCAFFQINQSIDVNSTFELFFRSHVQVSKSAQQSPYGRYGWYTRSQSTGLHAHQNIWIDVESIDVVVHTCVATFCHRTKKSVSEKFLAHDIQVLPSSHWALHNDNCHVSTQSINKYFIPPQALECYLHNMYCRHLEQCAQHWSVSMQVRRRRMCDRVWLAVCCEARRRSTARKLRRLVAQTSTPGGDTCQHNNVRRRAQAAPVYRGKDYGHIFISAVVITSWR